MSNRRRKQSFAGSDQWEEFGSTVVYRPVLGGFGNFGDNRFDAPGGSYTGISVRAFDRETRQWLTRWLDGRIAAGSITPPQRGRFANGIGTLMGDDTFAGRPIKVRTQWSQITPVSVHYEQALSADGGVTWETNWISEFARAT